MRLHNFFIDQKIGEAKLIRLEDAELLHQLKNVFRLEKDAQIVLLDNSGFQFRSRVELLTKSEGVFEVLEVTENKVKPARGVCLCVSMIKKDNFEWILEKGTELGVSYFIPIVSERSIKTNFNHERGLKIMKEASEQSGRAKLPGLYEVITLETALQQVEKDKFFAIAFHKDGKKFDPKIADPKMNAVFIGPEGGWSEAELEAFKKYGVEIYSLGDQTLRAETAAIAASALLLL
ncbi:TPA: hypothetical protein DCQ44_00965 [Candidatus Taylorbacteria bacterium]|nr:hypothetical protein [Candidatus Taylorbacteria bacterium]